MNETDVLVVGAGPVGLALAGDLAWRGVPSVIVERGDGAIYQPKMDLVGVRTMEFCRRWGIVDWVEQSPYPRDYRQDNVYVTSLTGYELGREPVPAIGTAEPPPQSPQRRERCPQDMFDPILRRFVESFSNVASHYQTEFMGLTEEADGVTAELLNLVTGEIESVRARYVVGCDGASSRVRECLGIPMIGNPALTHTTNVIFRSADVPQLHDKGEAYRFILIGPTGTWATIVAINGNDRWRMSIIGDASPRRWSMREIHEAIRRAVGVDFSYQIESVVPWTRGELVAESYGTRRVFIAGDAAHVMSPTGGFGMNTGIGDVIDLSWKIDGILQGWAATKLLTTYEAERRPVAQRNVMEASSNLRRMLSTRDALRPGPEFLADTAAGAAERRRLGEAFGESMKHEWHTIGVHLGYRYDRSPIVIPDGTPVVPDERMSYNQIDRPGARAPHVWIAPGLSTLDLFGRGFTLLRIGEEAPGSHDLERAAAAVGMPMQVVHLVSDSVLSAYRPGLTLVRPDGHVAWHGSHEPPDADHIIDTVRGVTALSPRAPERVQEAVR